MPSNLFVVGVTYDIVTPESAEDGDVAEAGWEREQEPETFRDALDTLRRYGPFDHIQHNGSHISAYGYAEDNYRTGESTSYCVHIYASERNLDRLLKLAK